MRLTPEAVATKGGAAAAVRDALHASLRRLRRDSVELYQLHNTVDDGGGGSALPVEMILAEVLPAFLDLQREGKVRHIGFTALGAAASVERLAAAGGFDVAQVPFNLLNPSAAGEAAGSESARLLQPSGRAGLGTIGIRLLAGGALGGLSTRHPIAAPIVAPIGRGRGTARDYAADCAAAATFRNLAEAGAAASLPALAIRYGLSTAGLDTMAVGVSSLAQLKEALDAVAAGPLEAPAMAEISQIQERLASPSA